MSQSGRFPLLSIVVLPCLLCVLAPLVAAEPTLVIGKHAPWKYFAAPAKPPENWNQLSFDDAPWKSGPAGFGYGDGDDRTVLSDMHGQYTAVYVRTTFDVQDVAKIGTLYLYVNFDDGFIAYLNGIQVAAASIKPTADGLRVSLHEAGQFEEFVIRDAARLLRPGTNLLAIEGHNANVDSSDFSLDPFLSQEKLQSLLGAAEYLADLEEFERRLLDQSSYLARRGFDYQTALKEFRRSIRDDMPLAEFVAGLQKLVMEIGDCHSHVFSPAWPPAGGFLPFRPADTDRGVAALALHRDEPLDPECPYLDAIDGIPLAEWLAAAARYVPRGSPQLVRRSSLQWLGRAALIRTELGLPAKETVVVGLRSADGTRKLEKQLRLTGQGYAVAQVRLQQTGKLDGNLGYLRIARMDARLVASTVDHLRSFRDTAGLVIDVRDNSGGTYDILRAIYGYFVPDDAEPYVTNIAAYRLSPQFPRNHIEYRPTYRADWEGWSDAEREAIRRAASAFRPEWQPPPGKFSEWHYMVLSRARSKELDQRENQDMFFYRQPVVVLCNAGAISASDGFLSALADLPQVTLVGESSGGGSGATRQFSLANTGVTVALSSMASFRANGKLFDGNGVEVDIAVKPTLEDFTQGTDSVLQRGIALVVEKSKAAAR